MASQKESKEKGLQKTMEKLDKILQRHDSRKETQLSLSSRLT